MNRIPYFVVLWLMTAVLCDAQQGGLGVMGRTTLHPDGTKSETVSNPNTREVEEKTFDANGVLILRKHYLLNERGQISQGNFYDGRDNLQARLQVVFDSYNRALIAELVTFYYILIFFIFNCLCGRFRINA